MQDHIKTIPYVALSRQHKALAQELTKAVSEVIQSGQFILGDQVRRFELQMAELRLNSAFAAVTKAQDAGADVGVLLEDLGVAGDFLAEAHLAFRSGDYDSASSLAASCETSVGGVVAEADRLGANAENAQTDSLILTGLFSGIGLTLLLVFGVIGWIILKKRFFDKVLEMKPEVEDTK